jgi:hypothetical protein
MSPENSRQDDSEDAEGVAFAALSFLADRPQELARFLSLSGTDPTDLRRLAASSGFLAGLLDFFLHDEALLLAFASTAGLDPGAVAAAHRQLDRGPRPLVSDEG